MEELLEPTLQGNESRGSISKRLTAPRENPNCLGFFWRCEATGGIQDFVLTKYLSPRRGREHLVVLEYNEQKYLVICDHIDFECEVYRIAVCFYKHDSRDKLMFVAKLFHIE
jgi:hypothetical protein